QPHSAGDQEIVDLFSSVLSGDVSDARVPTDLTPGATDCGISRGWGVREDGAFVDTSDAQGSVKNLIYERFATMISRIEMDRVGKGAPFALVVNATAEHLAEKKGRAATGAEAEFPIDLGVDEGLNGAVFFH
ncbi:HNH endonuclease, partial [Burkholderia multivorans]